MVEEAFLHVFVAKSDEGFWKDEEVCVTFGFVPFGEDCQEGHAGR